MIVTEKFYQELGHLFYAVASVDKKVERAEIVALKKCVKEEWTVLEDSTDEFGEDIAFQIETVFDWLSENHEQHTFAFGEFEEYFLSHKKIFTKEVKSKLMKTCESIAGAYASKNKAEETLLQKIKVLMEQ